MRIEIKEPGWFGKTVYIYENDVVKKPGLFGSQVYVIKNGYVCKPGLFGARLYQIKGNSLVEPDKLFFAKTLYTFDDNGFYQNGRMIYKLVPENATETRESSESSSSSPRAYEPTITAKVTVTVSERTPFDDVVYIESRAYCRFLKKYPIIRNPEYMQDNMYARFEFGLIGVKNPKNLHKELVDKGFYEPCELKEMLSLYKVSELKNVANEIGIKATGKKENIINDIAEHSSLSVVENIMKEKASRVSDIGKKYLEDHKVEMEYYDLGDEELTLEEYLEKRKKFSYNDMRWQKCQKDLKKDVYGYGEEAYTTMAYVLEDEEKFEEALKLHIRSLYICVNGTSEYTRLKKVGFPSDLIKDSIIIIGTCKTDPIAKLKEYYKPEMLDEVLEFHIPFKAVDKSMFSKMLQEILNGTYEDVTWEKKINSNFKKKLKESL